MTWGWPSPSLAALPPARYGLTVVDPPLAEPLSLVEAKRHLRVDHDLEDPDIEDAVAASREWGERILNRAIVTQKLMVTFDIWPAVIRLPRAPLQTVDEIEYLNTAGVLTTLAPSAYQVDATREPGRVVVAPGGAWPDTQQGAIAILRVTYAAGFGGTDVTPKGLKQGLRLLLGHWWKNREAVAMGGAGGLQELPFGVRSVLSPWWVGWLT